jgi:hypothetical protein
MPFQKVGTYARGSGILGGGGLPVASEEGVRNEREIELAPHIVAYESESYVAFGFYADIENAVRCASRRNGRYGG